MMRDFAVITAPANELDISQRIACLFVVDKIYLKKGFKSGDLARKIGIQTGAIARVISSLYGRRYTELTNIYRVEYAKKRIEEGFLMRESLEVLSDQSGFNSLSTFAKVFKKEFGRYPNEYWKHYSKSPS